MRSILVAMIGVVAAFALATLGARGATRHGLRAAAAQPRAARRDDLAREAIAPVAYARINSLWGETAIAPCMIGAVWSAGAAHASFAPQMRLSVRAPVKAAARDVALEPGAAPVVRVLNIADFRPRDRAPRLARRYDTLRKAA
ncbi:MAG: hypothetical protein NW200_12135 [Hyphomonadaceae bacterium]|nr:hypothetical protein [Hyphomonadaceae bacterium]